ncbi:MAG: TolC family protein [Deltaproteobacteria bacterium]|nr:MAG: TolC family protein [Deltaproteobacteria bacterium]
MAPVVIQCPLDGPGPRTMIFALALLVAEPIGLQQALERARAANPDLAAARQSVRVGETGVEVAGQLANPLVTGSHGPDEPTWWGSLEVKAPLFGQRSLAIAAAEREADVQRAVAQLQEVRVLSAVRRAYYMLAAAQARALLAEKAASLARDLEARIEAKVSAGGAAQLELLQAQLARRRAEQERDDRAAALTGAREDLARLIRDRDPARLEATDPLLPVPAAPPIDALLERTAHHPEVESQRREQAAALARASREGAAIRPLPTFSITLEKLINQTALGVRGGIAFELPLLSWNRGAVHQAQAQAELASLQAQSALDRLRSELRSAWARWQAATSRARSYAEQIVPAAERLERMARDAYELGRTPLLTVLQAQTELNSTRALAADAAAEAQRAFADLQEATGAQL